MGSVDSVPLREARQRAQEIDDKLTAYDFQHGSRVYVKHEDGTELDFNSAFLQKDDEWVYIFTEHHGFHVYHLEDLEKCMSYQEPQEEYEGFF